jgi:UDP-N-acetylglucosamine 2-epimerase (non-hydrolysing)
MKRLLFVFGTRPEAIKLAPVIDELRRDRERFDVRICTTGQHREMLDQVLDLFDLQPDVDLDLMRPGQELVDVAGTVILETGRVLRQMQPDLVVVQGDTTTAVAAAMAAFYARIDTAHVEAGLRSGDDRAPWPEEVNRKMISVLARYHFAPTEEARQNLTREGTDPSRVFVTGNTVVDALQRAVVRMAGDSELRARLDQEFAFLDARRRLILVTGHRRESFGAPIRSVCEALAELSRTDDNVEIVYPVHLNPNVQAPVRSILGGSDRIHLIEPVDYVSFIHLMMRSDFIVTDSGGVQEEAPYLGKAVLVTRGTTERPEGVRAGNVRVVGTGREEIVSEAKLLLRDASRRAEMSQPRSPYGDGQASRRIADILRSSLAC